MKRSQPYLLAMLVTAALAGAAAAGVVSHSAKAKTIKVTEREFRIHLSTTKIAAGKVQFVVKNVGTITHAFALAGPGVKLKRTAAIAPGKTVRLVVKLAAGKYALWCPFHPTEMKATLHVTGSASAGGTASTTTPPTTTPTTTSGGGGTWG